MGGRREPQPIDPQYTFDANVAAHQSFTMRFDVVNGDGVRVIGTPGGAAHYTSIGGFAAFYAPQTP